MADSASTMREKTLSILRELLPAGHPTILDTETLAAFMGVKSRSIHRSLCVYGHFHGLVPLKMPTGRLKFKISD